MRGDQLWQGATSTTSPEDTFFATNHEFFSTPVVCGGAHFSSSNCCSVLKSVWSIQAHLVAWRISPGGILDLRASEVLSQGSSSSLSPYSPRCFLRLTCWPDSRSHVLLCTPVSRTDELELSCHLPASITREKPKNPLIQRNRRGNASHWPHPTRRHAAASTPIELLFPGTKFPSHTSARATCLIGNAQLDIGHSKIKLA